ncbi:MAG TPA: preprotein translocase subunit SecE [Candidatus Hydrogenedentes bacterium]|nr:preprotein translocase subunit SecE [Candidatus Hydrogenedentota bacterium]HPG70077.1 preprotein translocase subunit SecE [Candidatus Hydrogenedentota bacterium]
MAKQTVAPTGTKPSIGARIRDFFQEVKLEMSKVTWPPREELKSSTQVVLILLVVTAAVIYVYDVGFQYLVVWLLQIGS